MRVTVFDRAAEEASWGKPGGGHPVVRTVEIADACPRCGGPRGGNRWTQRVCEDGEWYTVSRWENACGHADPYSTVIREAEERIRP